MAANAHAAPPRDDDEGAATSPEARRRYVEGNERYARGDYQGAVQSFSAAIAADARLPGPYRNLGLVYRALNRCSDALPMYEKYLALRPRSRFVERVHREIDLCRQKLGMPPMSAAGPLEGQGYLYVSANMVGGEATDEASVRVDGVIRGPTPATVPVTAGVHKIHLERRGFEAADTTIEIGPGERREVELTMRRLPEAAPPPVETPAAAAAAASGPRKSLRPVGWGLIGAAAAAAVVGAALGIAESDEHQQAVAADPATTPRSTVKQHEDRGNAYAAGAWAGLGVASAALLAAAIVFIVDPTRGETHEPERYVVAPSVSASGGGISAAVRF
jgi:hypothetical protein